MSRSVAERPRPNAGEQRREQAEFNRWLRHWSAFLIVVAVRVRRRAHPVRGTGPTTVGSCCAAALLDSVEPLVAATSTVSRGARDPAASLPISVHWAGTSTTFSNRAVDDHRHALVAAADVVPPHQFTHVLTNRCAASRSLTAAPPRSAIMLRGPERRVCTSRWPTASNPSPSSRQNVVESGQTNIKSSVSRSASRAVQDPLSSEELNSCPPVATAPRLPHQLC